MRAGLLLLALFCLPDWGAITHVSSTMAASSGGTSGHLSWSVTSAAPVTAGNAIIVVGNGRYAASQTPMTAAYSVTGGGGSMTQIMNYSYGGIYWINGFCAIANATGVVTATVTWSASTTYENVTIDEYSGLTCTKDYMGAEPGNNNDSSSVSCFYNLTTTNANDLLFAAMGLYYNIAATQGTGFTLRNNIYTSGSLMTEERILTATGSYPCSAAAAGNSGHLVIDAVTLKGAVVTAIIPRRRVKY